MIKRYAPALYHAAGGIFLPHWTQSSDGKYVLYTDHQEAVRQAREQALEEAANMLRDEYGMTAMIGGQAAALVRALKESTPERHSR